MFLLALSSLIFFFLNKMHSINRGETIRLTNDVKTIKRLNQELEAEIEERKKMEEQLQFYVTTDALTGVLNRRTGMLMLGNAMKEAKRNWRSVTICFVDINFLKQINDAYGHNEGDKLIVAVSTVLKKILRESDSICRLGGDEFLLIMPNCNEEQAQEVGARIERRMEHYNALEQKQYKISLSYGFAEHTPCCSQSIEELLEIADRRMYQMKQGARSVIYK
ncbi:MAG: GGDEF domain-containing protein [Dethiobacter sp.]|nr:GGDEF domain-containing protein [Dethiobacter sp.]